MNYFKITGLDNGEPIEPSGVEMNETQKSVLLVSQATQLLREVREDWMDWSDTGQVSQKLIEVFELLHQAEHEFDEEYLSKALEYLYMAIRN